MILLLMSNDGYVFLLFLIPIFTITILRSGVLHLFELGKSKSRCKKIIREMTIISRLMLFGYVEACDSHATTAKWLRLAYWASFILIAVSAVLFLCSLVLSSMTVILKYIFFIRLILLDFPVLLLFFVMTKHGKNGGVTWTWDIKEFSRGNYGKVLFF